MSRALRTGLVVALASAGGPAFADDGAAPLPNDLDLRLTLSSFLYKQSGADAAPLVDQGANPQNASPVKRFFGDLRVELSDGPLQFDGRVRETTSQHYQSGVDGGGEVDLRTVSYRIGTAASGLTLGRQYIEAVGETKIDGAAFSRHLTPAVGATVFAGLYPLLGSRSLDTDYVRTVNADGTTGDRVFPVAGGLGLAWSTMAYHGDVGVAGVYVPQDIPDATSDEKTRVYTTTSGYWRPAQGLDLYHFALVDVAGGAGVQLTNGSLGLDARPLPALQLSLAVHHVSTDLLQITARNLLSDPDPNALGIVQNNLTLLHVSQDAGRAAASLALAENRFELTLSGGYHRRPGVSVALADGTGAVVFPEAKSADATLSLLDRRSIFGLRAQLSASLTDPIGDAVPNRSRGTIVRASVGRLFDEQRGQIEVDAMVEHFDDLTSAPSCLSSNNPLTCYGSAKTTAAQFGALGTWRVAREWLVVADVHLGYQNIRSSYAALTNPVDPTSIVVDTLSWPTVWSVTSFVRLQWRFH